MRAPSRVITTPSTPLAERIRPTTLDAFVGQERLVGPGTFLATAIAEDRVPSMILWGPPGSGKTTLARIIAHATRADFVQLSATGSGLKELREIIAHAGELQRLGGKTVLFVDEIHRWNKAQQDALLPHVESGTVTFIGATTENPSFEVVGALLSRARVFVLERLEPDAIATLLRRALADVELGLGGTDVSVPDDVITFIANIANGDARTALNTLEAAINFSPSPRGGARGGVRGGGAPANFSPSHREGEREGVGRVPTNSSPSSRGGVGGGAPTNFSPSTAVEGEREGEGQRHRISPPLAEGEREGVRKVTIDLVKQVLQKSHLLYDKTGEEHYNVISALHKSMRGGDASASVYWLARMLEGGEDPLYVARRLVRFASEDIGLANTTALLLANAAYDACHKLGMPECTVHLAQCAIFLAKSQKSVVAYDAYTAAKHDVEEHGNVPVPLHLRNAPTKLMKELKYGKGYQYTPKQDSSTQTYLPPELQDRRYVE